MRYRRLIEPGGTYFFTLVLYQRRPLFADTTNIVRWQAAVAKVQKSRPFEVDAQVVLPDHVHVLWSLPSGDGDFATRVRLVKSAFTRSLDLDEPSQSRSRAIKGERDIWQRRYWEHLVRDEQDFARHLDYIHYNPVKHGLVSRAADWPHSTFQAWAEKGVYEPWWGADMPPLPDWARE